MAKRLPRSVMIHGVRYRIRRPAKVKAVDGDESFGTTDHEASVIDIQRGLSEERAWWTLKHEIAHAAWDLTGAGTRLEALVEDTDARQQLEEDLIRTWLPVCEAAWPMVKK